MLPAEMRRRGIMMLADVHAHLTGDPALPLNRAQTAGVGIILAAATDVASARKINAGLAEKYEQVKACIGIHPWRANIFTPETEKELIGLARRGGIAAVSETGIDRVRRMGDDFRSELQPFPLEVQIEAFYLQVRLAVNYGLLLVLHDRGATEEILKVIDSFKEPAPWGVIHGFSGTIDDVPSVSGQRFPDFHQ